MLLPKKKLFLLLFLQAFVILINAQTRSYRFDRLGSNEGLSYSQVNCIYQDKKGFMWFGTALGLNRYDGYNIANYFHSPQDSTTLSANSIHFICDDENENLLVASRKGLDIMDESTGKFKRLKWKRTEGLKKDPVLLNYHITHNEQRLFGTNKGIYFLNSATQQIESFTINGKNAIDTNYYVRGIVSDKFKNIWVSALIARGTDDTSPLLIKINPKDGTKTEFILNEKQKNGIYYDYLGNIWIPIDKGLLEFDPISEKQKTYYVPNTTFYDNNSFYGTTSGDIWQGFWSFGLTKFDVVNKTFEIHVNDPTNNESISDNVINDAFEDVNGVLWFATNEGVSKLSFDKQHFAIIPYTKSITAITTQKILYSIKSNYYYNRYYIGTNGDGLILYDEKKHTGEAFYQ